MSDENGQEIGVNVYDDEDELIEDEEAAAPQPVEVVREEIMTVTKNPDAEDNGSEDDLYEVVKAHSDQISRLTDMVESLQSQIKRIDQRQESDNKKTSSVTRNKSTIKTKKNKATSKKPKGKSSKRK
ncbi:MAG: hypothetical protein ACJ705_02120 [Nitrososphaeraceae archaeon]|jgi:hypothetical protein